MTLLPFLLTAALAGPAEYAQHMDLAAQAARAEQEGSFDVAYDACEQAVTLMPDGPRAQRCAARLAMLEARRDADGTFGGWTTLYTLRRTWRELDPDQARQQVLALLGHEGIAQAVHADAVLWLARDSLSRRDDPQEALGLTGPLFPARDDLPDDLRKRLVGTHALALARAGRLEEAKTVEAEVAVRTPAPRPTPVDNEAWRQQRARIQVGSWVTLALFGAVAAPLAIRAAKRPPRPWGLVPLTLAVAATWLLADQWSEGAGDALPYMLAGFVPIHLLAAFARSTEAPAAWRLAVSVLAAAATLAVAWLALAHTQSLGWVGL